MAAMAYVLINTELGAEDETLKKLGRTPNVREVYTNYGARAYMRFLVLYGKSQSANCVELVETMVRLGHDIATGSILDISSKIYATSQGLESTSSTHF